MKNLVNALKAMADEPRMNILVVLASRGAVCVSHLQEAMRVPQPTVSRYLSILKNAGLLEAERRGQWVYYTLNGEEDTLIIEMIRKCSEQLKDTTKIKRIMDRLDKLEQQPSLPASVEAAPTKTRKAYKKPVKTSADLEAVVEKQIRVAAEQPAEETPFVEAQAGFDADVKSNIGADGLITTSPKVSDLAVDAASSKEPEMADEAESIEEKHETPDILPKKAKRGKKQLPPSLFDF